ncbi:alpha/beta fold hydrolase [Streptomyces longispororuber]|uniref:alpha/beta fold hydrolase n=1 Tax=Streptomyces longispororuber TaxID=68230 RepID=UPI0033FE6BAF
MPARSYAPTSAAPIPAASVASAADSPPAPTVARPASPARPALRATFGRTVAGSGPGLLLAHGAGGSVAANFGPVMAELTSAHRVVGVDYPGTGTTPRAQAPLTLDALADELVAAADAEGLETFAIAGYSLGTAVAVRAAARHPERVTALVLTAPFARLDTRTRLTAEAWRGLAVSRDRDTQARFLLPLALGPAALESLSPEALATALRETAETAPEGTADHVDLVIRTDTRADLPAVAAPTLVITTTEDQLIPPALQREVAAGIPGARTAELATGHLPFAENPTEWQRLITDHLRRAAVHPGTAK